MIPDKYTVMCIHHMYRGTLTVKQTPRKIVLLKLYL
jgi:hypothetical protein